MQEKLTSATAKPTASPAGPAKSSVPQHTSNPFTTTWQGIQKLFKYNTAPFIGTTLFGLLLGILAFFSIAAVVIGIIALVVKNSPDNSVYLLQFTPDMLNFYRSFSDITAVVGIILGTILFIGFAGLSQIMPMQLVVTSSENQTAGFGELFKHGLHRILPFVSFVVLVFLATALLGLAIALLVPILGILTVVVGIVVFITWVFANLRITFAAFAVISENMGPIAGIKRSWQLTKGHFGEVLGIVSATFTLCLATVVIFELLLKATETLPILYTILTILLIIISFIIGTIAIAGFSERFVQLRNLADGKTNAVKTHPSNYLALVLLLVVLFISGIAAPKTQMQQPSSEEQELQQLLEEYRKNNSETLPSEGDEASPSDQAPQNTEQNSNPESEYDIN